ncbi:response regulator with CheY-like receiver domain and winged-helix DNA-binding domain [Synechococcus sp. PCC 7502]|uniref:response regulator n=1 Tax=Synechococcus sp. PCC 7502 TaxID=1173263 RepID=UPI00029F8D89|nr:response regulator [Synechococcus sp. PCC 7502]AFY72632.1 response regulator with CheY-like receiver domain and winged-helix DNA-binding domain [Synechococcus sp. PCC 7502]
MANDGFNVLVVDDNEMNRDTLRRRLKYEGFTAELASSGKEAMTMLRSQPFDLVLLDIMMPGMDGYQVLEAIKADKALSSIAVIMVSAIDDLDSMMRCTELGADDYLTKPFDPVLLRAAIARSLKRTPTVAPKPVNQKITTLQSETKLQSDPQISKTSKEPTNPPDISLQEIVTQIINTGQLTRKSYMHFSKAIFNGLFSSTPLTQVQYGQINIIFTYLQSGRIKVID